MKKEKSGYILLHRCITENHHYFSETFCTNMAWIDLLLLAAWKKSTFKIRGIVINVPRGTLAYSVKTLAQRWRWSRGKVNRFLNGLENEHQIVHQKTSVTTLISIVNYGKYQLDGTANRTANVTTDGHQTDTSEYINKKDKKGNDNFSDKNYISSAPLDHLPVSEPMIQPVAPPNPDPPKPYEPWRGRLGNLEQIKRELLTKNQTNDPAP